MHVRANDNSNVLIDRSKITGNHADDDVGGLHVYNDASHVTVRNTTIAGNTANLNLVGSYDAAGGAWFVVYGGGSNIIENSTISDNRTNAVGGGLFIINISGTTTVLNSTISGNEAEGSGGGIEIYDGGNNDVFIRHSTIYNNRADSDNDGIGVGGGIHTGNSGPTVTIEHTIVAGNSGFESMRDDIVGLLTASWSLIGDDTGATIIDNGGNQIGTGAAPIDPLLATLALNGGLTKTHAPKAGSPVIDAGNPAAVPGVNGVPLFDQRGAGFPRKSGLAVDIGAHEVNAPRVNDVLIRGSGWNNSVSYSFASLVPQGKQLAPIYTDGVNTIKIQFTEDVRHWNGSQLSPLNGTELTLFATGTRNSGTTRTIPGTLSGYDQDTHIATWTFATLAPDRYRIDVTSPLIRDGAGNSLNGKWDNRIGPIGGAPATQTLYDWTNDPMGRPLLSGNSGNSGTDFKFLFALLPGDYSQNGILDAADEVMWADPNQSVQAVDGNGDNQKTQADFEVWRTHEGNNLPFLPSQADFNLDGIVDVRDFAILRSMFGNTGPNWIADANHDNIVDSQDLVIYLVFRNTVTAWYSFGSGAASGVVLIDSDTAPHVMNVTISGSNSTHNPYSFATHVGSGEQLRTVPVGGADTVSITFSEEANVDASYLRVVGLGTAYVPALVAFTYDAATMTAVWRFASLNPNAAYLISLSDAVTDTEGYRLDGEWVNPASVTTTNSLVSEFPSGDGHAGGNFNFVFTLLAGDADLNNLVNFTDYQTLLVNYNITTGMLFAHGDFNGNGGVSFADYQMLIVNYFQNLQNVWMLGDLNGDHVVNDADIEVIANNLGMTDAGWADGDLNGDESVTIADIDLALAQFGLELAVVS